MYLDTHCRRAGTPGLKLECCYLALTDWHTSKCGSPPMCQVYYISLLLQSVHCSLCRRCLRGAAIEMMTRLVSASQRPPHRLSRAMHTHKHNSHMYRVRSASSVWSIMKKVLPKGQFPPKANDISKGRMPTTARCLLGQFPLSRNRSFQLALH